MPEPEPTLYLFDGYNILHAGGFRGPADLVDRLADFVAVKGLAASSSSTAVARIASWAGSRCATRAMRTLCWSGLRRSTA